MSEQQIVTDMAAELFAELGPAAQFDRDWPKIEAVGLASLLLSETHNGFGGTWEDALPVFQLAGATAVALPVVEAIIAARLAEQAGMPPAAGPGSLGSSTAGAINAGRFTGAVSGVGWGRHAAFIIAPAPDGPGSIWLGTAGAKVTPGNNIVAEPRDVLHFAAAPCQRLDADVFAIGALARTAQIAGALEAALQMSVNYVNERQQFGRALAKFQAVQQSLATFACEAAAANCAAMGAFQAMQRGDATYEIPAAKLRANMAVGEGTSIAHQVHGAIGFTKEYSLHPLTRRLWAWRSEFGSDQHWASRLGGRVAQRGAAHFWSDIAARTDPLETTS